MSAQVRIGGIIVQRCTQDATVALGVNAVTNRSLKKENNGVEFFGDGVVAAPSATIVNFDPDWIDHPVFQLDNFAFGPF